MLKMFIQYILLLFLREAFCSSALKDDEQALTDKQNKATSIDTPVVRCSRLSMEVRVAHDPANSIFLNVSTGQPIGCRFRIIGIDGRWIAYLYADNSLGNQGECLVLQTADAEHIYYEARLRIYTGNSIIITDERFFDIRCMFNKTEENLSANITSGALTIATGSPAQAPKWELRAYEARAGGDLDGLYEEVDKDSPVTHLDRRYFLLRIPDSNDNQWESIFVSTGTMATSRTFQNSPNPLQFTLQPVQHGCQFRAGLNQFLMNTPFRYRNQLRSVMIPVTIYNFPTRDRVSCYKFKVTACKGLNAGENCKPITNCVHPPNPNPEQPGGPAADRHTSVLAETFCFTLP